MILEIHAQEYPHGNPYLHGTREAFEALRNELSLFLAGDEDCEETSPIFCASDGESYAITFHLTKEDGFQGPCTHYLDSEYRP